MAQTLRIAFMCLVWALIMKFQLDYEQDQTATRNLKDGLEIAVHDAGMMLDIPQFVDGKIVYNQLLAETAFGWAMEKNIKATVSGGSPFIGMYIPTDDSFFKEPIEIVHVEFIDESTQPGVTYPCVYGISCGNPNYEIFETIEGPSIVIVGQTISPRFFSTTDQIIRQAVVYEYSQK